jgi:hypothetical protein
VLCGAIFFDAAVKSGDTRTVSESMIRGVSMHSGSFQRFSGSVVALGLVLVCGSFAQVSVTTFHNDGSRSGQNLSETALAPQNVNSSTFGKLFSYPLQGHVYAQPLYVPNVLINGVPHNVVYVASEHDVVYAFDADSNVGKNANPLWSRSFTTPDGAVTTIPSSDLGCPDLVPEIGITGTPVIDLSSLTMYLVVRTKESGAYKMRLHALDVTSGAERAASPVDIAASVPGSGDGGTTVTLNTLTQNQRAGLVLSNGILYIGYASLCDTSPYHGWLLAYDPRTLKQSAAWNSTANGYGGGIWAGGSAPAVDANGSLFFATGNGTFDAPSGGVDYGDSVVRMPMAPSSGTWQPSDYFAPYNQASLTQHDVDLGSGGTVLLPDQPQGSPHQHLLTVAGKQGVIYLIDRDQLGEFNAKNNSQIVQVIPGAVPGLFGITAWWNNQLYISGHNDVVKSFAFNPGTGLFSTTPASTSPSSYLYILGSSPSVSANGSTGGILWAAENPQGKEILHAYDATNLASELFNTTQNSTRDGAGNGVRFIFPTIANGKVYLASNGKLNVYGLLLFNPGKLTFPTQVAGTVSATQTATLTNVLPGAMNIASVAATGEFGGLGGTCPAAGGTVAPGAQCTISVAFMPQGGGTLTGTIRITLADSPDVFVLPLSGTGKSVTAGTGTLNLGTVPVGQTGTVKTLTLTIHGSDSTTFGTISTTNSEFAIASNTCAGTFTGVSHCALGLTLTPAAAGTRTGTLTIQSTSVTLSIKLTGTGSSL